MNEAIKPNDKDIFKKENVGDKTWKISFRDSYLTIKLDGRANEQGYIMIDNKCRTLYDLKKINGYLAAEMERTLLDVVN